MKHRLQNMGHSTGLLTSSSHDSVFEPRRGDRTRELAARGAGWGAQGTGSAAPGPGWRPPRAARHLSSGMRPGAELPRRAPALPGSTSLGRGCAERRPPGPGRAPRRGRWRGGPWGLPCSEHSCVFKATHPHGAR